MSFLSNVPRDCAKFFLRRLFCPVWAEMNLVICMLYSDDPDEIKSLGNTLCDVLHDPLDVPEGIARIGGSAGFTTTRSSTVSMSKLLERADYAPYQSKEFSKGKPIIFSEIMIRIFRVRGNWTDSYKKPCHTEEIGLAFQPIVYRRQIYQSALKLSRAGTVLCGSNSPDQCHSALQSKSVPLVISQISC